jgi:ribosome-binding factor A
MNDLLATARARDEEVAKLAAAAKPAGDANPYREPKQIEDQD